MTRATAKYLVLLEAKSFGARSEVVFDLIWLISLDGRLFFSYDSSLA